MGLMFSIYCVPFISLPLSSHFIFFSQFPRPQCIHKPVHAHGWGGGGNVHKPAPLCFHAAPNVTFFLWKRTQKEIPSELLWNSYTLVMSPSQGREVYIMVISLICAPAATGNKLITNKKCTRYTKKMCRLPPGGRGGGYLNRTRRNNYSSCFVLTSCFVSLRSARRIGTESWRWRRLLFHVSNHPLAEPSPVGRGAGSSLCEHPLFILR